MTNHIRIGDMVELLPPVINYSAFVGGNVGEVMYISTKNKSVDVKVGSNSQIINIIDTRVVNVGLFEGLTYG